MSSRRRRRRGRRSQPAEDAILAGLDLGAHHPLASRMLLVSVFDDVDLETPRELEVEVWWDTVDRCELAGLELWEWVVTSNDVIRLLSATAETEEVWRSAG